MVRLVCLGDSITDAGRLFSLDGLGHGYVKRISQSLPDFQIINRGTDGFTAARLLENVRRDCVLNMPDFVTVLIGINDIGLLMHEEFCPERQEVCRKRFVDSYDLLVRRIREETGASVLLMEPFIFPYPEEYKNWFPFITEFSQEIQNIAEKYEAAFLPLHRDLNRLARQKGVETVTPDGIHLTEEGHLFLSERVLKKIKEL